MEFLIIAIFLLLLALVGHGLWLLLAAIIGAIKGGAKQGEPPISKLSKSDLEATSRQIHSFREFMTIDDRTFTDVQNAVQDSLQRLKAEDPHPEINKEKIPDFPPLPFAQALPEQKPEAESKADQPPVHMSKPATHPEQKPEAESKADQPPVHMSKPAPHPKATPKAKPKASLPELFSAFVEEKNIRWGELVGGMLIIFCSLALVVSQWRQITSNETGRLAMFVGVNAILFGVGMFMYKRLSLVTSGKGLLIVSSLLCPLNFLAIAAMTEGPSAANLPALGGEIFALALFAILLLLSSRMICPIWSLLITFGVMAPSGIQLLIRRLEPPNPAIGYFSLFSYILIIGIALYKARKWKHLGKIKSYALFLLLGLTSFASFISLGFLIYKTKLSGQSYENLSTLLTLHGIPAIACGALLFNNIKQKDLHLSRTMGASITIVGMLILTSGMVLAWPISSLIIPNAFIAFALVTLTAFVFRMPILNLPSGLCLCIGYLYSYKEIFGEFRFEASLCFFSAALGIAAWLLCRSKRKDHGLYYLVLFIVASVASFILCLIHWYGKPVDSGAAWIFGFYAVLSLVCAFRWASPILTWIGSAAALVTITHLVAFRLDSISYPWQFALLLDAGFTTVLAGILFSLRKAMVKPLCYSSLFVSTAALLMILIVPSHDLAWRTFAIAIVWVSVAFMQHSMSCFTISQVIICITTFQFCDSWAILNGHRLQVPHLQMTGLFLSLLCLAWSSIKWWKNRPGILKDNPSWRILDEILKKILLICLLLIAGYSVWPGQHDSHAQAGGLMSWLWLGALGLAFVKNSLARMLLLFALCLLFSGRFENSYSVLRWMLTIYWCVGAGLWIWFNKFTTPVKHALILLTALPLVLLSFTAFARLEPVDHSIWSFSLPIIFLSIGFTGLSSREKNTGWALAGSFLLNLAVTLGYLIHIETSSFTQIEMIRLIQFNVIASAIYGLVWRYLLRLNSKALDIQVIFPRILSGLLISLSLWLIILNPDTSDQRILETSSFLGWLSIILFLAAAVDLKVIKSGRWLVETCFALSAFLSFALCRCGDGYHTLLVTLSLTAWILFFARQTRFVTVFFLGAVILALRAAFIDPWWAISILIVMACLFSALACRMQQFKLFFVSGALFNVAASLGYIELASDLILMDLIHLNAITISLTGFIAFFLDPKRFYHCFAVLTSICISGVGVVMEFRPNKDSLYPVIGWIAAVLITSMGRHRFRKTGLYLLGLFAIGLLVNQMNPLFHMIIWNLTLICAGYVFLVGLIVRDLRINQWFTCILVFSGLYLAAEFPDSKWLRLAAVSALYPPVVLMGIFGKQRTESIWMGIILATAWAWCWIEPGSDLLQRLVLLLAALVFSSAVVGIGFLKLCRKGSSWIESAKGALPLLAAGVTGAAIACLGAEVYSFLTSGSVNLAPSAIALVALTLLCLCIFLLIFATGKSRDSFTLSKKARIRLVYGAEVVLVMLLIHIRICMPYLFHGFFTQYWPIIVILVAFSGIGFSEMFTRKGLDILSDPVGKTSLFLPLLPVIGYWARNTIPGVDSRIHYSIQLLLAGLYYGAISIRRRSFIFGFLAALLANGGLWYFLHSQEGYGILDHPQLWLIPFAVVILIAAQINRNQLSTYRLASIRYFCLMTIYISSTMDIFIAGVANSPWLPLILMGLSVFGVLLGMLIRVRAYLFLGSGFLLLSLISMVWHATARYDWTWLWWISGICLGLSIFFLFAIFEKKRAQIIAMVNNLKKWDG